MNRLLIVLVLIAFAIIGLGFYQGWFLVGSDNADGKSNVKLSLDKDKFKKDEKAAVENVENLGQKIKEKFTGTSEKPMDGTVVSVRGDTLTMASKEGTEHSHTLAANAKVTCDGKVCMASDLKSGMNIRVITETAAPHAVTRIEAREHNPGFDK